LAEEQLERRQKGGQKYYNWSYSGNNDRSKV